jgi:hypothetical protein
LLEGGADVNARDATGRTPLDAAARDDVRDVLRAAGGTRAVVPPPPAPSAPPSVVLRGRRKDKDRVIYIGEEFFGIAAGPSSMR